MKKKSFILEAAIKSLAVLQHPCQFSFATDIYMVEVVDQQDGNVGKCHQIVKLDVENYRVSKDKKNVYIEYIDPNEDNRIVKVEAPYRYDKNCPEEIIYFSDKSIAYEVAIEGNKALKKDLESEKLALQEQIKNVEDSLSVLEEHNMDYIEFIGGNGGSLG